MMNKIKTTEIPSRAKHLYIQLYCEKKGGQTNENFHNAAQSWLSLSLTKKQHFYDAVTTKYAVKKAQKIIQTEPYLRAKFPSNVRKRKRSESNKEPDSEYATPDNLVSPDDLVEYDNSSNSVVEGNNINETLSDTAPEAESNKRQERVDEHQFGAQSEPQMSDAQKLQNSFMSIIDEDTYSFRDDNTNKKDAKNVPLSEPVVPFTKTGKDLFELLRSRNGSNKTYDALTTREKNFYGHAVRAIKRDYVNKYKEYLESLSSRQLFDYYMKTFR